MWNSRTGRPIFLTDFVFTMPTVCLTYLPTYVGVSRLVWSTSKMSRVRLDPTVLSDVEIGRPARRRRVCQFTVMTDVRGDFRLSDSTQDTLVKVSAAGRMFDGPSRQPQPPSGEPRKRVCTVELGYYPISFHDSRIAAECCIWNPLLQTFS
ncbi:hypothetical protein QBC43DRAFT_308224 [Cladorrhinum sp. PSN259]|nr:hypothetical protein QBC43DRAFT_308224 [Cladorrhinum sp. PSN259]